MEKAREIFAQVVASAATSAAMSVITGSKIKRQFISPKITVGAPTLNSLELQKNIKGVLVDQLGAIIPKGGDNLFMQLTEIAAESVLTQSLSSLASYPFAKPDWQKIVTDIATDAAKNAVFNIGR